jgi:hypothetical protein
LVRKKIDLRSRECGGALHQGKRVCLIRQPRLFQAPWTAIDSREDAFGARRLGSGRSNRNLALANPEEDSDVPSLRRIDHDPRTEVGVRYSLTRLQVEHYEILG